jgi:hypothetical protein
VGSNKESDLCNEIMEFIYTIEDEVFEEEEYVNCLSVTDEERYKRRAECLEFAYRIYEITDKFKLKIAELCKKLVKNY